MNKVSESKVIKSQEQWRAELSEEEYEITRCSATERAFSGLYWDTKTSGIYNCKCCNTPLFDSNSKYDSGTGWPSFYQPISKDVVATRDDMSYGMRRIEVVCAICEAHLGHLFPDGPNPTGLRFCMNSASLELDAKEA